MKSILDPELTKLASDFTVRDYKAARDAEDRKKIADGIRRRFTERYIAPVSGGPTKHGFTMMAISCLMIEAFVSLRKGWKDSNGKSESAIRFFSMTPICSKSSEPMGKDSTSMSGAASCTRPKRLAGGKYQGKARFSIREPIQSTRFAFSRTCKACWTVSVMD
jgi:hypothetical protein